MKLEKLFLYYMSWHYTAAFLGIIRIYGNALWFFFSFFSISLLLKTLLSPLERLQEKYKRDPDIKEWISTFAVNILMRLIGAMLRLFVIVVGLLTLLLTTFLGVAFFIIWIVLPALPPIIFFGGLTALFL